MVMPKKILLAASTAWPSAARYAGGFVAAGCKVDALSPDGAPVRASRYVGRHYKYRALFPLASLRKAIKESKAWIIVACDDRTVTQLVKLYSAEHARRDRSSIARVIERSLGQPLEYPRVMSRHTALSVMRSMGVRVPKSLPIAQECELNAWLDEIGFPAVLKTDGSWGGEGVIIAHTREEAHAAWRKLAQPRLRMRSLARAFKRRDAHYLRDAMSPESRTVSVQQFIAGKPAASAFAAVGGKLAAHIAYDVLEAQGTIGPPNIIRRVDCPQIYEAARNAAACFGLTGLHGLDFIRDAAGDVHLIEINPRATQGGTLAFGAGRDLPSALAAAMFEPVPRGMREAIANDVVAFFPRAWQCEETRDWLGKAHHDIPWDDPAILRAAMGIAKDAGDLRAAVYEKLGAEMVA